MSEKRTIKTALVTVGYQGWHWDKLAAALAPAKIVRVGHHDREGLATALKEADVAILGGDIHDQILAEGHNLKWIHCDHSGLNASARPEVFERRIILTGSAGRSGPVLAEHVFYLILSLIYDANGLRARQLKHEWGGLPGYNDRRGLYGKTIGIIGLGYTGQEVAKRAKSFYMNVLGYTRAGETAPAGVDELFTAEKGDAIDELLRRSDIVVLTTRLTDKTYHLIDERAFSLMKRSAFLINMSRGSVIDETALAKALADGSLAGAGSDVFEQEPLAPASPLWDLPTMVITPHNTPEMPDLFAQSLDIICDNIELYRAGGQLRNQLFARDVYTRT